jgi:hypothetical protein
MATELDRARAEVEQALKLCDSETADGIIGSPPPEEYGVLIRGVKAAYQMLWMMGKANGLKQNQTTFRMGAQVMLMLVTIVHYAYALGIRRGSESASQRVGDGDTSARRRRRPRHHDAPKTGTGSKGEQDSQN